MEKQIKDYQKHKQTMSISSETSSSSMGSSNDDQNMYFEDFYDLSIFLNKGQFGGDYYRCIDRSTSSKHMVKIVKPLKTTVSSLFPSSANQRFSREGVIWRRMKHRNIVHFIRMFKSSKEQFFVTEYVKDGNLFDQIGNQYTVYSEKHACHFGRQLLEALAYLRKKRVIHRSITADNILVKPSANGDILKICGFSLSLRLDKHQKYTNTEPYGVPLYLSPEVLREKPISYSVDIWSVGVILSVLLSGHLPFWQEKPSKLYSDILNEDIENVLELWENVSGDAKELVAMLLEKNPATRITAEDALKHDWFIRDNLCNYHCPDVIQRIQQFNLLRNSPNNLFTPQTLHSNREQKKTDLISSSFGEKRRARLHEQERRNRQIIPSKMTVVTKTKVDLNNNKTRAKVCVHFSPRKVSVDLSGIEDEGVDL